MSGGGSTTSTTTVPPQFLDAYSNTVARAQQVASQPYQAYNGQLVAGFSGDQTQAQAGTRGIVNNGTYLQTAQNDVANSAAPLYSTVGKYQSPFTQQVVNATIAEQNNQDAQQQNQLRGNAASAGALGGDRVGVAQGILGGQQALANNQTIAGLNQQGFQTALSADEAQSSLDAQAAYGETNLNNTALTNENALAASGQTQQQQQQAGLNTAYEQWQAAQAFPYQQTGWLANITEGIGSNVGGTSTTTTSWTGGRVGRASGGIIPGGFDAGGATPVDSVASLDPYAMPGALNFWNNDTMANSVLGALGIGNSAPVGRPVNTHFARGGRAGYDGGGGILGDIPDVATGYIPTSGGGSSGGSGKGPPSAPQVQASPFANPATDIGAASGAVGLYNGLGGPQLFGANGAISGLFAPSTAAASGIVPGVASGTAGATTGMGAAADAAAAGQADASAVGAASNGILGAGATGDLGAAGAASPGFLGTLGSAVDAGATGLGSAASAVGSGIAAGASALGDAAASAGAWLLSLLALKDGGAVPSPQHHATGGIVVPFPQDRVRRASGGIIGNSMPYSAAPPVPVQMQATGTDAPMGYMPGAGGGIVGGRPGSQTSMFANGGGILGGANPFGLRAMPQADMSTSGIGPNPFGARPMTAPPAASPFGLRTGGIVVPMRHYDNGGALPDDPSVWGGAGTTDPSADQFSAQPAPASTGILAPAAPAGSGPTYTPEKPNLWLPALAAIATSALGRHHDAGHNIAEGVMAGLGAYNQENTQYQQGQEKAVSLDQEAKKLADDAEFHRASLANESAKTTAQTQYWQGETANSAERISAEKAYQEGMLRNDAARTGLEGQRLGIEAQSAQAMANLRDIEAQRGDWTPAGTTPDGTQSVMTNRYTGEQKTVPLINPTVYQQGRLDNSEAGLALRSRALDQALQINGLKVNQGDRAKIGSMADTFYTGAAAAGKPITPEQATAAAIQQYRGIQAAQPAPAAAQPSAAAPPPPPQPGQVVGKYTYKGGNPADPSSWTQ